MKIAAAFLILLATSACLTTGRTGGLTTISSKPDGAVVRMEGFSDCLTPCAFEISHPVNVTVAKAGYKAQRFQVKPGKRNIKIDLELAAPTENVEETGLPEL